MQVTTNDAHITHAVMGGMDMIECGITGDAHFMHMMSATLYRDQKMAMVREIICNAWDAHIMVDKISPIEITIDTQDNFLIVKDYGPGISHEMIGPIYGVYGGSTKKKDGRQTGGFGLGCKSPWSYTDTFEVTSCHQGKRAVYQMTKSSAEREGKPGIKPIVAGLPTTDTGITVKVRLDEDDLLTIQQMVKQVVKYGGIPCLINGVAEGYVDYSTAKNNWIIVNKDPNARLNHTVYARYGNVIYPVIKHEKYNRKFQAISATLGELPRTEEGYLLILLAPPDSLTPTPSREELSTSELTLNTLEGLMDDFLVSTQVDGSKLAMELGLSRIEEADENQLFNVEYKLPIVPQKDELFSCVTQGYYYTHPVYTLNRPMVQASDLIEAAVSIHYPSKYVRGFRDMDIDARMERLLPTMNKRLANLYRQQRKFIMTNRGEWEAGKWVHRNLLGHIAKHVFNHEVLRLSNLYTLGLIQGSRTGSYYRYRERELQAEISPWKDSKLDAVECDPITIAPYMLGRVIVTYSRNTLHNRLQNHPTYGGRHAVKELSSGFIVYCSPRSAKHAAEAMAMFTKLGYEVIDMTEHQAWEGAKPTKPNKPVDPDKPKIKRVKKTGWVRVDAAMYSEHNFNPYNARDDDNSVRIEEPLFYVQLKPKKKDGYDMSLDLFRNIRESRLATQLFGQYGAIVQRNAEIERFKAAGIPSMSAWVADRVVKEMSTNKRILQHFKSNPNDEQLESKSWVLRLVKVPEFKEYFEIVDNLTKRDRQLLQMWEFIQMRTSYYDYAGDWRKQVNSLTSKFESLPVAGPVAKLVNKVRNNVLIDALNGSFLLSSLQSESTNDEDRKILLDLLISAINGKE